ncbi:hypothetical protein CMQ_7976 [Grosmannia clavigera kw1407]|uniref:Kinetochore protein n=1 Tax=Grosmannia clavigera (strain kw1407 / UAMH 11150) TaxID=655863 RepID=F0XRT0_GROCL|nr:uncharacterized protein CMQ_7976 [Grosmannia clavigera kw1407]EFW99608.1 hypothetical protein CMQ_7976 [Grosmannia clavigera kw1407]
MASKWVPLEQEALAAVQTILADCARPVLSHLGVIKGPNSERRQELSRLAISATTRRLRSKLVKGIPFPPPAGHVGRTSKAARRSGCTQESDFDFERTLECVKSLEQQLDPLQHSITLLEEQRKREERTLEADYAALRQLEINAQAETRTWRDRTRRLHVLAPTGDKASQSLKFQANVELLERPDKNCDGGIYEDIDKGLSALSAQLGSHMESLRNNLLQVQDVVPAIAQSKAVLQQALRRHLDDRQFAHVVLGN